MCKYGQLNLIGHGYVGPRLRMESIIVRPQAHKVVSQTIIFNQQKSANVQIVGKQINEAFNRTSSAWCKIMRKV